MRVVIDTNLLISHLFWPDSKTAVIVRQLFRNHTVLRSTDSFAEVSQVVMRKKFDRYLPMDKREAFLTSYANTTEHVVIRERIDACRDKKDNMMLELAVSGYAELVITGDDDLLMLDPFRTIRIVSLSHMSG